MRLLSPAWPLASQSRTSGKLWPESLGGIPADGRFFGTMAPWINAKLAPGHTSQSKELGLSSIAQSIATLRFFFMEPTLVWFAMSFLMHVLVPYDIDAARAGWSSKWVLHRFMLNYSVALAYYSFFHVVCQTVIGVKRESGIESEEGEGERERERERERGRARARARARARVMSASSQTKIRRRPRPASRRPNRRGSTGTNSPSANTTRASTPRPATCSTTSSTGPSAWPSGPFGSAS